MILRYVDIIETSRRIKELCVEKGFSAADIQKNMHLQSVQSVYSWWSVKSKNIPGLDHMLQLSDLLGCTMEDMLVLKEVEIQEEEPS